MYFLKKKHDSNILVILTWQLIVERQFKMHSSIHLFIQLTVTELFNC